MIHEQWRATVILDVLAHTQGQADANIKAAKEAILRHLYTEALAPGVNIGFVGFEPVPLSGIVPQLPAQALTVFIPVNDGLYDDDYGPHVFHGKLTLDQIKIVGHQLLTYPRVAVCGNATDGYYISGSNDGSVEPDVDDDGEMYTDDHESHGKVVYCVKFITAQATPI